MRLLDAVYYYLFMAGKRNRQQNDSVNSLRTAIYLGFITGCNLIALCCLAAGTAGYTIPSRAFLWIFALTYGACYYLYDNRKRGQLVVEQRHARPLTRREFYVTFALAVAEPLVAITLSVLYMNANFFTKLQL